MVQEYDQNVAALSEDVYYAMQISLEFLDKGMKGMLVGDLSSYALTTIEKIINRNEQKLNSIQKELEQALEEMNQMENTESAATVDSFYDSRFGIDEEKLQVSNMNFDRVGEREAMEAVDQPRTLQSLVQPTSDVNYGSTKADRKFDPTEFQDLEALLERLKPGAKD